MANIPNDLQYTEEHEYVRKGKDGSAEIGITDFAQGELGDIVYIELPKVGTKFGKHDVFGTIEAVKAVSELFAPIAGEVVAINDRLDKEPALLALQIAMTRKIIRVKPSNPSDLDALLGSAAYTKHIGQ